MYMCEMIIEGNLEETGHINSMPKVVNISISSD